MANKDVRRKEKRKPKKGAEKVTTSPVVTNPPVEVVSKGKAAREPKE